jgi:hypothetical protein
MYLFYVDDSGSVEDTKCNYCVLAGFAIYERQPHWITKSINDIISRLCPDNIDAEIHATHIRGGKGEWRKVPKDTREQLLKELLLLTANNFPKKIRVFAAVISKSKSIPGTDIQSELFTQVISRFDKFLIRHYNKTNHPERGIAIFDKCTSEIAMQKWTHIFKGIGNKFGDKLNNLSEVPLCLDSKMSRLIQLADVIAYSIFRKFEFNDDTYYSIIENCFDIDSISGKRYGLYTAV